MMKYYFKIEVTGTGQFPLDQLRRFEMFPIDLESTAAIRCSFDDDPDRLDRTFVLGMYANSFGADGPCIARFESFGFNAKPLEVWRGGSMYWNDKDGNVAVAQSG